MSAPAERKRFAVWAMAAGIGLLRSPVAGKARPSDKESSHDRPTFGQGTFGGATREGHKKYDVAATPHRRAERHDAVTAEDKAILTDTHTELNLSAIQRQIQALTAQLLTLTTSKTTSARRPAIQPSTTRASADESTNPATRAS